MYPTDSIQRFCMYVYVSRLFIFTAFCCCLWGYCTDDPQQADGFDEVQAPRDARQAKHANLIQLLASQAGPPSNDSIRVCSICLDPLERSPSNAPADMYFTKQLPCEHIFHTQCIDMWGEQSNKW